MNRLTLQKMSPESVLAIPATGVVGLWIRGVGDTVEYVCFCGQRSTTCFCLEACRDGARQRMQEYVGCDHVVPRVPMEWYDQAPEI